MERSGASAHQALPARAYVQVHERLDGWLLVSYKGKVLTPGEAPLSSSFLRNIPENNICTDLSEADDLEDLTTSPQPQSRIIWYADPEMKRAHRDLVKAGMGKARQLGKRIGRPRVTERPEFATHLASVMDRLNLGGQRTGYRICYSEAVVGQ